MQHLKNIPLRFAGISLPVAVICLLTLGIWLPATVTCFPATGIWLLGIVTWALGTRIWLLDISSRFLVQKKAFFPFPEGMQH